MAGKNLESFALELSRNCWAAAAITWEEVSEAYAAGDFEYAERLRLRAASLSASGKRADDELTRIRNKMTAVGEESRVFSS